MLTKLASIMKEQIINLPPWKEINELKQQNTVFQEQQVDLINKLNEKSKMYDQLQAEYNLLDAETQASAEAAQDCYDALNEEYGHMKARFEDLQKEHNKLKQLLEENPRAKDAPRDILKVSIQKIESVTQEIMAMKALQRTEKANQRKICMFRMKTFWTIFVKLGLKSALWFWRETSNI